MKKFIWIIFLALAAFGAFRAYEEWDARAIADLISAEISSEELADRRGAGLKIARAALEEIETPSFYAFVTADEVRRRVETLTGTLGGDIQAEGFESLTLDEVQVELFDGVVAISTHIDARLSGAPVEVEGYVRVEAVPVFDGASLALIPLGLTPSFERVRVGRLEDRKVLPKLVGGALGPLWKWLSGRLGRATIPLQMGVDQAMRLKPEAGGGASVSLSPSEVQVRAALTEAAALVLPEGVLLIGEGKPIALQEIASARDVLVQLRDEIRELPKPPPCRTCELSMQTATEYLPCLQERLSCQTDRAFEALKGDTQRVLDPVELLALANLADSESAEDQALFEELEMFLAPRWTETEMSGWEPKTFEEYSRAVRQTFVSKAGTLSPELANLPATTTVAVSRTLVVDLLRTTLETVSFEVAASLPDNDFPIQQDFRTEPAPNLNCVGNARSCPSEFRFRDRSRRKCPSRCTKRECRRIFGQKVCVDVPDLGCAAKKINCERLKEQERIAYEAEKAAKHAVWLAERGFCQAARELEITGCEVNQGWLNHWGDKKLGRIRGNAVVRDTRVQARLGGFEIDERSESLKFRGVFAGATRISAGFKLEPLSEGHLVCVAPWEGSVNGDFQLEPVQLEFEARVEVAEDGQDLVLRTRESSATLRMTPHPRDILVAKVPEILARCPAVNGFVPGAPALLGGLIYLQVPDTIEAKVPAQTLRMSLLRNTRVGDLKFKTRFTDRALISNVTEN